MLSLRAPHSYTSACACITCRLSEPGRTIDMGAWQDLTADQVTDLLEGGLDVGIDDIAEVAVDEADDAAFLSQLLQELEGNDADDPLDGLDDVAPPDTSASEEEYCLSEDDVDSQQEQQPTSGQRQASGRSTRSGQVQNVSGTPRKRKRSSTMSNRKHLANLIRDGLPARNIRAALKNGRLKLDIVQQRSQRVKDSFLLHPSEQELAVSAGAAQSAVVNKPEVVRRTRTRLEQVELSRHKANAAKSDWGQAQERLQMLKMKSDDAERIAQQKQVVRQANRALTEANSEMLTAQVSYTRRKLPAGMFYMFKEGGRKQVRTQGWL